MSKTAKCPTCGADAQVYVGENEHKQNTAWCQKDGRVALPVKPKAEPDAEVEAKAEGASGAQDERPSVSSRGAPR